MINEINLLDSISKEKKIEILRKNWMSQDAKGQMAIVKEFGWEKVINLIKQLLVIWEKL